MTLGPRPCRTGAVVVALVAPTAGGGAGPAALREPERS